MYLNMLVPFLSFHSANQKYKNCSYLESVWGLKPRVLCLVCFAIVVFMLEMSSVDVCVSATSTGTVLICILCLVSQHGILCTP